MKKIGETHVPVISILRGIPDIPAVLKKERLQNMW
jgi:hypothetical protein